MSEYLFPLTVYLPQGPYNRTFWSRKVSYSQFVSTFIALFNVVIVFSGRIFSLLSAILLLGNIRYKKKTYRDDCIDICNPEVLPTISELLEVRVLCPGNDVRLDMFRSRNVYTFRATRHLNAALDLSQKSDKDHTHSLSNTPFISTACPFYLIMLVMFT